MAHFISIFSLLILNFYLYSFEERKIIVKDQTLLVQLAKSPKERSQGLMHRKSWGKYQGMLFVFENERRLSFWMKNTYLPLSIGFFSKNLILVDIQKMKPHQGQGLAPTYKSSVAAKYALEVPIGWFEDNKIGLGSRLRLNQAD